MKNDSSDGFLTKEDDQENYYKKTLNAKNKVIKAFNVIKIKQADYAGLYACLSGKKNNFTHRIVK
ncbi:hypothetical protein JDS99_29325 [Bacillus cereus group sp. N6]|uniref:hypothetical protein n=1 Tax=Bacillus cereus group sp. N6 TaxID=2794583 RepID=UPI0018F74033|nr:hypothetical protein [Bacillus cereus group sp. N6]MBJ8113637.1 hypothetical protein [Bacillus cereus group sp. N6]